MISKKKGGRPPLFSDEEKRIMFDTIRKARNNNDAKQYRPLQAHIDNNSTIFEVQQEIFRRHSNVANIWKKSTRRTKEEVKELEETIKRDTKEERKLNKLMDEELNQDAPEETSQKEIETLKERVEKSMQELEEIKSDIDKKKVKLSGAEHWEILEEYGIINLLNDLLNLYLYEKPDGEFISPPDTKSKKLTNEEFWKRHQECYQELFSLEYDMQEKKSKGLYPTEEEIAKYYRLKTKNRNYSNEWKRRQKRVKSTYSYVKPEHKVFKVDKATNKYLDVGASPESHNKQDTTYETDKIDIPETIDTTEETDKEDVEYTGNVDSTENKESSKHKSQPKRLPEPEVKDDFPPLPGDIFVSKEEREGRKRMEVIKKKHTFRIIKED